MDRKDKGQKSISGLNRRHPYPLYNRIMPSTTVALLALHLALGTV
jgi:hypothetical protein